MTFTVLLVLGLVVLAGVIAFAGDRLGTYVGRRRLSLFGARPKRTGQIVGVMAGILIMLSTLGVLALAFENATETLLNFQRTLEELNRLRVQERVLNQNVADANAQLTELRTALAEAEETIRTAEEQRDAALTARDAVLAERDELLRQRDELQALVDQAALAVQEAEARLRDTEAALAAAEAELDSATDALEQARRDRDAALLEAEEAQAEANAAQEALRQANSELADLEGQLVQASLELGAAQSQVQSAEARLAEAESELAEAEAAQAAAERSRDEALAVRDSALAELDAAIADRDAAQADRDAALGARDEALAARDAATREVAELTQRLTTLNEEVALLEATAEELRLQAEELDRQTLAPREANPQLPSENERLQQLSASLAGLNESLEDEIRRRNEDLVALQGEVAQLRQEVEDQARELAVLQQEAGRFERGDVYFVRDQLIYSGAVQATTPAEAREQLAAFIAEATEFVSRRGVERIRVTTEQFNLLVDVIVQTPGEVLIRLISPSNQISSTIDVLVEAIENTVLFQRGQLIVSTQLHLGSPELPISQDEIRTTLANLKADAVRKMRRAGLDEGQLPDFGPVTEEMFTNMLLRLTGPVTIGLVATEPVSRAGPAHLELMILY